MDKLIKILKALLFPRDIAVAFLFPAAMAFLAYAAVSAGARSVLAIASYVFSAYALTVLCIKVPKVVSFCRAFKSRSKYMRRWKKDVRFRVRLSLSASFAWNAFYGVFLLCLGLLFGTFWYTSMGGYYVLLAAMRFYLVCHIKRYKPAEDMVAELKKYRNCGVVFLAINLALTVMVFFMVYWNRSFNHNQIVTIAMAAYTFTTFTLSVVNIVRFRKLGSPVFSASKAISLAAACVSLITLTSTMLTTFGGGGAFRPAMLGGVGGTVSLFIVAMALYMIIQGTKALRQEKINGKTL